MKSPAEMSDFFYYMVTKILRLNRCNAAMHKSLHSAQNIAPLQFHDRYSVSAKPDVLVVYRLHLRNGL